MPLTKEELGLFDPPEGEPINWHKLIDLALAKKIAIAEEQVEFMNAVLNTKNRNGKSVLVQAYRELQGEFINALFVENSEQIKKKYTYHLLLENAAQNEEPFLNLKPLPDGYFDASFCRELSQIAGVDSEFIELVLKKIDFATVDKGDASHISNLAIRCDDLEAVQLLEKRSNMGSLFFSGMLPYALENDASRIVLYLMQEKGVIPSSEQKEMLVTLALRSANTDFEILKYALEHGLFYETTLLAYTDKLFKVLMETGDARVFALVENLVDLESSNNIEGVKLSIKKVLAEKIDEDHMPEVISLLLNGKNFQGVIQSIVSDVIEGRQYQDKDGYRILLRLAYNNELRRMTFTGEQLSAIIETLINVNEKDETARYLWPCIKDLLERSTKEAFASDYKTFKAVIFKALRLDEYDVVNLLISKDFKMNMNDSYTILIYLYQYYNKDIDHRMLQLFISNFINFNEIPFSGTYESQELGECCLRFAANNQLWSEVNILVTKMKGAGQEFKSEYGADLVIKAVQAKQWQIVDMLMGTLFYAVKTEIVYASVLFLLAEAKQWEILVKVLSEMPKEFQVDYKVMQSVLGDPNLKNEYHKKQILKLLVPHLQNAQYTDIKYLRAREIIIPKEEINKKLAVVYGEPSVTNFDIDTRNQFYKQMDLLMDKFTDLYYAQFRDKMGNIPADKKLIERAVTGFIARVPDSQGVTYWSHAYNGSVDVNRMNPFEMFKDIIGLHSYFTNDDPARIKKLPELFKLVKSGLEELYFMLLSEDVDANKKVNALNELFTQLIKCGPGITESIEFCRNILSVGDLKNLLAQHRENILHEAAKNRISLVRQLSMNGRLHIEEGRLYIIKEGELYTSFSKPTEIAGELLDVLQKILSNKLPTEADELAKFNKLQVELFKFLDSYFRVFNEEYEVHVIAAFIIEGQKLGLNLPSGPNTVEHQGIFLPAVYKDISGKEIRRLVKSAMTENFPNNIEAVSNFIKESFTSEVKEIWPGVIPREPGGKSQGIVYTLENMKALNILLYRNGLAKNPEELNEKLVQINDDYTKVLLNYEMLEYCIAESLIKNGFVDVEIHNSKSNKDEELNYFIIGNNVYLNITDKEGNESALYNQAAIKKILTDATELNMEIIMAAIVSFSKTNPQIISVLNKVQMPIDNENLLSLAKTMLNNDPQQVLPPTMIFSNVVPKNVLPSTSPTAPPPTKRQRPPPPKKPTRNNLGG